MKIKKCRVCGCEIRPKPLFSLNNAPSSAQGMPMKKELYKDKAINYNLVQCSGCGLVQLDCTPVSYYKEVIRATGLSSTYVNMRKTQYTYLIGTFHLSNKKIIEIGCGKGENIEILKEFPVKAYGIEYGEDNVKHALKKGLNVYKGFAGKNMIFPEAPFDAFLSFNFLEHLPNPNEYLRCIYENLAEKAVGLITVPNLSYILERSTYFYLIRDHIANYDKETLKFVLIRNGFNVLKCEELGEDLIQAVVQKNELLSIEKCLQTSEKIEIELKEYIKEHINRGEKIVIWGASHYSFTIIQMTHIAKNIDCIIDSASFKQGRYSPVSHIRIMSPEYLEKHKVDNIIIIAPGYTEEIACVIKQKYNKKIKITAIVENSFIGLER